MISGDVYASDSDAILKKVFGNKIGPENPENGSSPEWGLINVVVSFHNYSNGLDRVGNQFASYFLNQGKPPSKLPLKLLHYLFKARMPHEFVKAKKYEGLKSLIQVTGPEILLLPDTRGIMPLSEEESLASLDVILRKIGLSDDNIVAKQLKATFLEEKLKLLKAKAAVLIEDMNKAKVTIEFLEKKGLDSLNSDETDQWDSATRTVHAKERELRTIIESSPLALQGQKLEEFSEYFQSLTATPEGRRLLRDYRLPDGSSLVSFYAKKTYEASSYEVRYRFEPLFYVVIETYLADNIPFTKDVLDVHDLTILNTIINLAERKSAPQILREYRNSKGYNLAQLAIILNDEDHSKQKSLHQLRNLIRDNAEFLDLLREASPGTETAESMIMLERWGTDLLKELDPSVWVKPGRFKVTPLMKRASEARDQKDFNKLLAEVKAKGITNFNQVDEFGNSFESIKTLYATIDPYQDSQVVLFVESLKNRPLQGLWADLSHLPYRDRSDFDPSLVLRLVHSQQQTSSHLAFLQEKVDHVQYQADPNELWKSLFKMVDEEEECRLGKFGRELAKRRHEGYLDKSAESDFKKWEEDILARKKIPTAMRSLEWIASYQDSSSTAVSNMLAKGGTFGFNFSGKLSPRAGNLLFKGCVSLGDKVLNEVAKVSGKLEESEIVQGIQIVKDRLFQCLDSPLDIANAERLLRHQVSCAVITLHTYFGMLGYGREYYSRAFKGSKSDIFEMIDNELQGRLPNGQAINSKARFQKLYDRYDDHVFKDAAY
ncbi:MAG: hypothetical protein K2W94_00745 [Alphaproteobacteria bacterium]|nr:hypothetical protein [Alphaproteobacteria bacterium]